MCSHIFVEQITLENLIRVLWEGSMITSNISNSMQKKKNNI
jgi:hypothetical protein